jgi:hypothetical protein
VGHIAAVTELDTDFGTLLVDGIRELSEVGQDFVADIELPVKTDAALVHGTIRDRGHTNASACNTDVVVLQHLCRAVVAAHILERS